MLSGGIGTETDSVPRNNMPYLYQPRRKELTRAIKENAGYIGGDVLDVGAGSFDRYSSFFTYAKYIRMDLEGAPVYGSAEAIPFENASFDSIVCTEALEYVENYAVALKEFVRVLRPGGRALVTFSNYSPPHGTDYWRFMPRGIESVAKNAGLEVRIIHPVGGYFGVKAHMAIRRQLLRHSGKLFRVWAKLYGDLMMRRDQKRTNDTGVSFGFIAILEKSL